MYYVCHYNVVVALFEDESQQTSSTPSLLAEDSGGTGASADPVDEARATSLPPPDTENISRHEHSSSSSTVTDGNLVRLENVVIPNVNLVSICPYLPMTTPNPRDSINLLRREEQVTIFRLRCGHVDL